MTLSITPLFALSACLLITAVPSIRDAQATAEPRAALDGPQRFLQVNWNRDHASVEGLTGEWRVTEVDGRIHRRPRGIDCAVLVREEQSGELHTHEVPLRGELVISEGWIHVAIGARVRGYGGGDGSLLPQRAPAAVGTHVWDANDVIRFEKVGECWESVDPTPAGCVWAVVCAATQNPFADDCEISIQLSTGGDESFSSACGGGLSAELCSAGSIDELRVCD